MIICIEAMGFLCANLKSNLWYKPYEWMYRSYSKTWHPVFLGILEFLTLAVSCILLFVSTNAAADSLPPFFAGTSTATILIYPNTASSFQSMFNYAKCAVWIDISQFYNMTFMFSKYHAAIQGLILATVPMPGRQLDCLQWFSNNCHKNSLTGKDI